ncbi:hypothetical protein M9Y10_006402 [Tritrichomonas musculus]|uniref:Protein kinase domain-containing protein n=1 Tax=Tritrichomonas musculus TaxID=1915356 RepID=A0ABR2JF41_9EUKA
MDSLFTETVNLYDELINKSGSICCIFPEKCKNLCSTLDNNLNELMNLHQNTSLDPQLLQNLQENLKKLSEFLDNLSDKEIFMVYFIKNIKSSIQQIVININQIMSETAELLKQLGIENPSRLPSDELYQDYSQIDDILMEYLLDIRKRRQEVDAYMKQSPQVPTDADEFNVDELNKKSEYKKDIRRLTQNDKIGSNLVFDYYKGKYENDNVTIMRLKNKDKFKRIFSVLTQISHSYVESLYGCCIDDDKNISILTNRDGDNLNSILYQSTSDSALKLESGDRTILSFKIAQAMSYLHSRNVIHRNLNTYNIHVIKNRTETKPMIVGFRNSRIMPESFSLGMTAAQFNFFENLPPKFIAPEYEETGDYDEKIDVFTFGGVLYELLLGHPPFKTLNDDEVKNKLKAGELPPLPEIPKEDDEKLNITDLIKECWKINPKERISFDMIIDTMIRDQIIFPSDIEKKNDISNFYESNTIKRSDVKDCIDLIEAIKTDIGNTYQYRYEFIRCRRFLNNYQFYLRNECSKTEGDVKKDIKNLLTRLKEFSSCVSNASYENWIEKIAKDDKKPVYEITNLIESCMEGIHQLIVKLGYKGHAQYFDKNKEISKEALNEVLIFDYRELEHAINFDIDLPHEIRQKKRAEIQKFKKERNIRFNEKKTLCNRLNDLLTPFKSYELKKSDFFTTEVNILDSDEVQNKLEWEILHGKHKEKNIGIIEKVFHEKYFSGLGEQSLTNLRNEIGYLTRFSHKYIVDFIGFYHDKENNDVSLIIRNSQGITLADKMNQLDGNNKTKIAFKIAEVMSYLNNKSIFNFDIKPSNIILDGTTPKIANFCTFSNGPLDDLSSYNNADVLAFALILLEMLLMKDFDRDAIRRQIDAGKELQFPGNVSVSLQSLIKTAANPDPAKRPSFNEIINNMINETIMFPGSERDYIEDFYSKKNKK